MFIEVRSFTQESLTEGREDRKGLFSSRTLRPSVQSESKGGRRAYSMISMMRTGRGSPCVIHRHSRPCLVSALIGHVLAHLSHVFGLSCSGKAGTEYPTATKECPRKKILCDEEKNDNGDSRLGCWIFPVGCWTFNESAVFDNSGPFV